MFVSEKHCLYLCELCVSIAILVCVFVCVFLIKQANIIMRNAHVRVWAVWAMLGGVHGAAGAASRYTGAVDTNRHQQPPMGSGMQRVGRI